MTMESRGNLSTCTYEEFAQASVDRRCEWIDGVIYDMAGTSVNHNRVVDRLYDALGAALRGGSCERFRETVEVRFMEGGRPKATFLPDIMVVCEKEKIRNEAILGAPTLIIEVVSPTSSSRDYVKKQAVYHRYGVREYWIVNPMDQTVTVCLPGDGQYATRLYEAGMVQSACFPEFAMDIAALFEGLFEG